MAYLEGRLRGHTSGSEGEHAGHVLEVEVDMSAVGTPGGWRTSRSPSPGA